MNVENRKLFRNKDARARLAGMGGIIASSPELLGTVQKFSNGSREVVQAQSRTTGFDESRGLTEKDLQMAIISDYRVYMKMKKSDPESRFYNMPLNEFEDRVKDALIKKYAGGDRAYGESLINDAIGEIAPEQIENYELDVEFTGPGSRDIRPSTGLPFDQQTLFRDPNQAAAVAQDFVAMPEVATQSNMAPSMVETAPVLSQPNVSSDTFASELMIDQQARRPTVGKNPNALDAPSEETGISSLPQSAPAREGSVVNTFMRNLFSPVGDAMRKKLTPVAEKIEDVVKPVGESIQTTLDPLKVAISTGRESPELRQLFSETIANQKLAMPGGYRNRAALPVIPAETITIDPSFVNTNIEDKTGPDLFAELQKEIVKENAAQVKFNAEDTAKRLAAEAEEIAKSNDPNRFKTEQELKDRAVKIKKDAAVETTKLKKQEVEIDKEAAQANARLSGVGDPGVGGPEVTSKAINAAMNLSNVEKTPVTPGDPDATTNNFIDAALGGKTGSPKENVKSYEEQFREMLGIKDKDKAKEMWHNLSMIGFAIAAGRDPSALANIAQGMLEGTKMMKADRDADEKLNQDIALMAFAERNKDKRLAAQLRNQKDIASIRSSGAPSTYTDERLRQAIIAKLPTTIDDYEDLGLVTDNKVDFKLVEKYIQNQMRLGSGTTTTTPLTTDIPSGLPDPTTLSEGQTVTDRETGQVYTVVGGAWQ